MEPKLNNPRIINLVYEKYAQSTRRTFLAIGLTFPIIWFSFDYLTGEPYTLHLIINICLSILCINAYFLSKRIPVPKLRFLHWSIFYNTTTIIVCYFTLTSENMFGYLLGLISGALMYSLVYVSQLRYFIPNVLVCFIMPFFFREEINQNALLDFYPFVFFLNFVHFFACIGVFFKFKHAYIVEELACELAFKNKKLENSNNLKRDLLRVMGHDIVNELHIHKMIHRKINRFFEKEKSDDKMLKNLKTLDKSTANILNIVDTVRVWEAVKSGKIKLEFQEICVNDILEKSDYLLEEKLKKKNIEIKFGGNLGLCFFSDLNLLTNHVYNNLVSNAIKFSKMNSIINISCFDKGHFVEINVKDSGIGIPVDLMNKLFDPNEETTREGTSGEKGTGFGLPLVNEFISFLGGTIHVESSAIGHSTWSCFTIRIPKTPNL